MAVELISGRTKLSFNIVESSYLLREGSLESSDIGVELSESSAAALEYIDNYLHLGTGSAPALPMHSQSPGRFHWRCRAGPCSCPPSGTWCPDGAPWRREWALTQTLLRWFVMASLNVLGEDGDCNDGVDAEGTKIRLVVMKLDLLGC